MEREDNNTNEAVSMENSLEKTIENFIKSLIKDEENHKNIYDLAMNKIEPSILHVAMEHTKQNQSACATLLGISRGTLRKKLKSLGKIK